VYVVPVYYSDPFLREQPESRSEPQVYEPDSAEPELETAQPTVEPAPPAPPPAAAIAPSTMYVIPGCYIGNVEPTPRAVPAMCDVNRLVIYRP
jgi:hypothetical protein